MEKKHAPRQAFTLVELSIVLVILGLLVGGVLTGQALIRSAELRAIVTERDRYVTALYTFKDKYMALPGDMPNAYQYWGTACGTNTTALAVGCNGDGSGIIDISSGITGSSGEHLKVWEHLSRAGLIEGLFDGVGGADGYTLTRTANPASKFSSGYWNMWFAPYEQIAMNASELSSPNHLVLAIGSFGNNVSDGWLSSLSSLTNAEALNIDRKVDDGRAYTGTMRGEAPNCDDNGDDYYRLSQHANEKGNCTLGFILGPQA